MKYRWLSLFIPLSLAVPYAPVHGNPQPETALFEAKIRPVLLERCIECHGEKKQKGGLRLDSKAGWEKGGESGPALVPGNPDASLLIKAVRRRDKDLQMPPKEPLTPGEVLALEQWVTDGAPDPRENSAKGPAMGPPSIAKGRNHWAFQPLSQSIPPTGPNDTWSRTDLDRFVFDRLQRDGLRPSPQADKRSLLRRATFDLLGLPPTQSEVDAFEADAGPNAFARVVDRLLASPHYGEQWARHWLDVARYSDTKGYVFGREEKRFVHAWPYRDWVVRSLNSDLPYDTFLMLQIAAEQLVPKHSPDLAALGFLTLGRRFLGVTHDIIDDRIDVLMRGTQALTVACARCHDHKFDPIPTRDYYSLYGVFQSCMEKLTPCGESVNLPPAFVNEEAARILKLQTTLALRREEQSKRTRSKVAEHLLAQLQLEKYPEETFDQIIAPTDINPGIVRRWQAFLRECERTSDNVFQAWRDYSKIEAKDFQSLAPLTHKAHASNTPQALHPRILAAFRTVPESISDVARRYAEVFGAVEEEWAALQRENPSACCLPRAADEALRRIVYGPEGPCFVPDEHISNIERFFPTPVVEELWKLHGEVDRWLIQSGEAPAHATILQDRETPSQPRVFKRGNPLQKGETVPRQFLAVLSPEPQTPFRSGSGRLELARAIASPDNPLTARVMVNRVWMHHFGRGLVQTTSDFGSRAEPPTHPELLDWLARRFISQGWSLKQLHREIMLSAVYQQTSRTAAGSHGCAIALQKDPDNRLLWRMNPRRLSFEEMRDAWLSSTGELDDRVGGRPSELLAAANTRRTLYAHIDRERLPDVLRVFDFANPDLSIPQRTDTIVPQQALFAMNHPFTLARARALAALAAGRAKDTPGRVAVLTSALFQRQATTEEIAAVRGLLEADPPQSGTAAADPWTELAQALMLTNEFLFLD